MTRLASSRTGENPCLRREGKGRGRQAPYGMIREGGGNVGKT
jgi:hypothetical protein